MQCWKLNFDTNRHSGEWLSKCTKTKKIWLPSSLKMPCNDSQIMFSLYIFCWVFLIMCNMYLFSRHPWFSVDHYPGWTSRLMLNQHSDWCSVNTYRILDQQSVDSLPSIERLICIQRKLVDSQGTVNRFVDRVLINWVSIECQLRVWIEGTYINQGIDHGYCSTLNRRMAYMYVYMYVHII